MLILSRVCADFHDRNGVRIFSVTPQTRLTFQEAPEAIRDDPLFQMLLEDRSIEVSDSGPRKKQLENDPDAAPDPAGKTEKTEEPKMAARTAKTAAKT